MAKKTTGDREATEPAKKPTKKVSAKDKVEGESAVLATLAEMPESDRVLGERLHKIVTAAAPSLTPKLWYGMPAYAKEGKVVCFFQSAAKFKTRYATLGFMHEAMLDEGGMWPTAFALTSLTDTEEATIKTLVTKSVG